MKRLIAKRPIQYMGRTYDVGEVLPAYDAAMVAAWLAAGSAEWAEADKQDTMPSPDTQAADVLRAMGVTITDNAGGFVGAEVLEGQIMGAPSAETQAVDVLRTMGVVIMDDAGEFVGEDKLEEQIRAAVARGKDDAQTGTEGREGQDNTGGGKGAQEDQEGGTEGENEKSAGEPELLAGHLDAAQLERMTKPDLIKLAEDMGVDISTAKNNAERAAILAAVPVKAPKDENGGAQ